MRVKAGYRHTDVGVVPEDWKTTKLGAHGAAYGGLTGKTKRDFGTGSSRFVPFTNVIGNVVVDRETVEPVRVAPTEAQNLVRRGDLLFNGSSETPEEVAFCALMDCDVPQLYLNSFCFGYRLSDTQIFAPLFLAYLFRSEIGREIVRTLAQGSTRYNISKTALLNVPLPVPPIQEQRAIAAALSDVDALLDGLDRLISKKRDLKQATMQQLLTGETRLPGFSGEWEVRRLGDYVRFLKNGSHSRAQLTGDDSLKNLHYGDVHACTQVVLDPRVMAMPSLPQSSGSSLDRLQDGDLVFVDASEDLDGIGKSVEMKGISSVEVVAGLHTIAVRFDKSVLADGFKGYLQFVPELRAHLTRLAAGTKVYATNRAHIASAEIQLPGTCEQSAIAAVLSDMDAELDALEARREKTRALKQAMMQELLTGRTRLV